MRIPFQINSLDKGLFTKYFQMTSDELAAEGAYLFESDQSPCYPCRVSLTDAAIGETVLAVSFRHLSVNSPYCASGPIFVRKDSIAVTPEVNEIPPMLQHRLLSVRGYSDQDRMIEAQTVEGKMLRDTLVQQFRNDAVRYIQLHNAGAGCFNCTVTRV